MKSSLSQIFHISSCPNRRKRRQFELSGMDWKLPTSVHQIRSFLGLAGYYHRFIPDFSKIAKPMTELLKKEVKFRWDDKCDEAFHTLRKLLTTAPVLAQPLYFFELKWLFLSLFPVQS
jgi:hypothetical protein